MIATNSVIQSQEADKSPLSVFTKAQTALLLEHNGKRIDDVLIRKHARLVAEFENGLESYSMPAGSFVGKALLSFKGSILSVQLDGDTLCIAFESKPSVIYASKNWGM